MEDNVLIRRVAVESVSEKISGGFRIRCNRQRMSEE